MKKPFIAWLLGTGMVLGGVAFARGEDLADQYFTAENPRLTAQEQAALALAKRWEGDGATGIKPMAGPDGAIRFLFGAQQPSIVCAVLQVCDVALQPGELVNSIHLGDTARWTVEPAITGSGAGEIQHLIIKPMDVGLETSLVVTTNRRTYHLRLRSHRTEYLPQVAFTYPEEALEKWQELRTRARDALDERTLAATGESLDHLDFDYALSGTAPWKPVRVYNNGRQTVIQMPTTMAQSEAPTLLVVRKAGGLFSAEDTVMVNYRVQGDRYLVDTVFDQAILIVGVGRHQERVTVTRQKP
jgi:type IV secretion system protein VirB9